MVKNDVNKRVFSLVEEIYEIEKEEKEFLETSYRVREGLTQQDVEIEDMRKKFLRKYSQLRPVYSLTKLQEQITQFDKLHEDEKRHIFKSIKLGIIQCELSIK